MKETQRLKPDDVRMFIQRSTFQGFHRVSKCYFFKKTTNDLRAIFQTILVWGWKVFISSFSTQKKPNNKNRAWIRRIGSRYTKQAKTNQNHDRWKWMNNGWLHENRFVVYWTGQTMPCLCNLPKSSRLTVLVTSRIIPELLVSHTRVADWYWSWCACHR